MVRCIIGFMVVMEIFITSIIHIIMVVFIMIMFPITYMMEHIQFGFQVFKKRNKELGHEMVNHQQQI